MTKTLLIFFCLAASLLVAARPCRAQPPADAPAASQTEAGQIERLLSASVRQMFGGELAEATRSAEGALSLSRAAGDTAQQLRATNLLALALFRAGRTGEAIRRYEEAAALAAQAGDRNSQALALARAGNLLRVAALHEEALHCFGRAIALYRQERNRRGEALARSSLSAVYSESGEFEKARRELRQAVPMAKELNDKWLDAALLLKLGVVEKESGDFARALAFGLQALALDSELDYEAAKREQRRALLETLEAPETNVVLTRIELMFHLGSVYAALGDHRQSASFFERALAVSRERRRPLVSAVMLGNLAGARLRLGDARRARELATDALERLRRSGGSKHWESIFLYYLAEAERALGANEAALAGYRQAIAAVEQARSLSIPTEVSRAGIVSARHDVFAGAIDFLLARGRGEEAFGVAEAWHARAFLDILTESRIDPARDLSAREREREGELFAHIAGVQKELWGPGVAGERERELKARLAGAESELESFQLAMRRANPRYAGIKYPRPLKSDEVAKSFAGPDTALVEFVLGEQKSFAWAVCRGKVSTVVLPPRGEIDGLVATYRAALSERVSALTARGAAARVNAMSAELYRKLFAPLEPHLAGARALVVVPDGSLLYLPFETLRREGRAAGGEGAAGDYLLERFAVSYAPSATALGLIRAEAKPEREGPRGLVAFGDPVYADAERAAEGADPQAERWLDLTRLPHTRGEVDGIASLFPPAERRTFCGAEALEEKVKAEDLSRSRYLHFAAHGLIDETHPMRSGIALTTAPGSKEDGVLQMSEVMRLNLNAEVVTLSACRTGLGKLLRGEGMIGLTRAFQYAGAANVVVSLWNVNDLATAELMKAFYRNLTRGLPKDEALRQAKLGLLRGRQRAWGHPYFWAAFVLVGANS